MSIAGHISRAMLSHYSAWETRCSQKEGLHASGLWCRARLRRLQVELRAVLLCLPYERITRCVDTTIRMPNFPQPPVGCPPDIEETAELYALKRLSPGDALQFATHCLTCRKCAAAAENAEAFVAAIRGAARQVMAASGRRPRLCCLPSITNFVETREGVCARMRFEATACDAPPTRQCLASLGRRCSRSGTSTPPRQELT